MKGVVGLFVSKAKELCPFTIKASSVYSDHQGSGPNVPPEEGLPLLRLHEGPVLWLVCPGGKVSPAEC